MRFQFNSINFGSPDIQIPREVPHPDNNSPLDITNPADVIIYIVIPLILVILYLVIRKRNRKSKE